MQPCCYLFQTFSPAEHNYDICDQELLAVICSLKEWRQYLLGSPFPIEVLTNYKNLIYFKELHKLLWRQAWWLLFLQDFNMTYQALSSTQMVPADALSHQNDVDTSLDNTDIQLLPSNAFGQQI